MRRMLLYLLLILALALSPVLSVMTASAIASLAGCRLDEGSVHPCMVAGFDMGETLYTLFVLGWLGLVTLPLGAVALLGWILKAVIFYISSVRSPK